jgi:hypothetical protein
VRGQAARCVVVAAAVSLSAVRAQNQTRQTYRDVIEEFRENPDPAITHLLDLPPDVLAQGIDEAVRRERLWPQETRAAAVLIHTDAALHLQPRDRTAAWAHIDRAERLADALAEDPECAWFAHQWFIVVNVTFKDDSRVNALVDHWHGEPWYAATAAMDRGLDLEALGAQFGSSKPTRGTEQEMYQSDAFIQAAPLFNRALAAHLEIAAVHLGRLQMLAGHASEARRLFSRAIYESHWRTTTYLANLFLGSLDERDEEWSSAERRYQAAVASIGSAQTGRLALAVLLGRNGRGAEAARVLQERPSDRHPLLTFDPWWSYLYPYGDRRYGTKMILSELHVAVAR